MNPASHRQGSSQALCAHPICTAPPGAGGNHFEGRLGGKGWVPSLLFSEQALSRISSVREGCRNCWGIQLKLSRNSYFGRKQPQQHKRHERQQRVSRKLTVLLIPPAKRRRGAAQRWSVCLAGEPDDHMHPRPAPSRCAPRNSS